MYRVSFDFDNTLQHMHIQEYCQELLKMPQIEVWITTTRPADIHLPPGHDHNKPLWEVVERLNFPRERIIFTNGNWKVKYIQEQEYIWHLDDNDSELILLHDCKTVGINPHTDSNWRDQCNKLLLLN